MLALAVAISPDEQTFGVSRLGLDVLRYMLLVLPYLRSMNMKAATALRRAYVWHVVLDRCIEKLNRFARSPPSKPILKVRTRKMASNARKNHFGSTPWRGKGVVKLVVFQPGKSYYISLRQISAQESTTYLAWTYHLNLGGEMVCYSLCY